MLCFTFDTNCMYAIEEGRPEAKKLLHCVDAARLKKIDLALLAISASEKQKGGAYLTSFEAFKTRVANIGLSDFELLKPMGYYDVTYWDWAIYVDDETLNLEKEIHKILFPKQTFEFHCPIDDPLHDLQWRKWINRKCDTQALWCHIHYARDVFVTSDSNFFRRWKDL